MVKVDLKSIVNGTWTNMKNNIYLSVFKLLLNIFNDCLAIKANKCSTHKLWVNRVCSYDLTCDTK